MGLLLLAWLGAALQPCVLAAARDAQSQLTQPANDHCCLPAPGKYAPQPNCSAQGCAVQAIDQQQSDLMLRLGSLITLAALLTLAWPRIAPTIRKSKLPPVAPSRPHPTLAYCTLLI